MTKLEPGNIILVNFPFTNLQSSKVRPALVLSTRAEDIIILGIFSRVPENLQNSWIEINELHPDFERTGLKKTSIIKTEKITVIHQSLMKKKLGSLPLELMAQVKQTLRKTLHID
jgi:mRNA interferase MazF